MSEWSKRTMHCAMNKEECKGVPCEHCKHYRGIDECRLKETEMLRQAELDNPASVKDAVKTKGVERS